MLDTGKLKVATPTDSTIVVTRTFDAPRQLVFDAHTRPELIRRWCLGPPGWTMPKCEVDLRVGGDYLYGWEHPDQPGAGFEIGGTYKEIAPPGRIVHVERFMGHESLCTLELSEKGGKTTMTYTMDFHTKESRDAALATGMTGGMEQSYERLEQLVAKQAA
jgi:uncharacterized protein YndB with AHSA1/START domain